MDTQKVLRYWTLHGPNGSVVTCELLRTAAGLEVRCDQSAEGTQTTVAHAETIEGITDALDLAETLKASYLAKGWAVRAGGGTPPTR